MSRLRWTNGRGTYRDGGGCAFLRIGGTLAGSVVRRPGAPGWYPQTVDFDDLGGKAYRRRCDAKRALEVATVPA